MGAGQVVATGPRRPAAAAVSIAGRNLTTPVAERCSDEQFLGADGYIRHDRAIQKAFQSGMRVRHRLISRRRLGTIDLVHIPRGKDNECAWSRATINWDPCDFTPINRSETWLGDLIIVDGEGNDVAEQPPLPPGERAPGAPALP